MFRKIERDFFLSFFFFLINSKCACLSCLFRGRDMLASERKGMLRLMLTDERRQRVIGSSGR